MLERDEDCGDEVVESVAVNADTSRSQAARELCSAAEHALYLTSNDIWLSPPI